MTMKLKLEQLLEQNSIASHYQRNGMSKQAKCARLQAIISQPIIKEMLWDWNIVIIDKTLSMSLCAYAEDIHIKKNELQFWIVIAKDIDKRNIKTVWDLARNILRCDSKYRLLIDHFA